MGQAGALITFAVNAMRFPVDSLRGTGCGALSCQAGRRSCSFAPSRRRGRPWRCVRAQGASIVTALVALGLSISGGLQAGQGLSTVSAATTVVRPSPSVFLSSGEGFVPGSRDAGMEWSANLLVLRGGAHSFWVKGGALWIDGSQVGTGPVRLEAGEHDFRLSTHRPRGAASIAVEWQGPDYLREPIPPRFFSSTPVDSDRQAGRTLFEDLGCSNCHLSDSPSIQRRPGPVLTGIGGRRKRPWIRHWLDSPSTFQEWATMPLMLTDRERADVASYLAGLDAASISEPRIRNSIVERGRTTFQSLGCGACHWSDLPLRGLGSKMTAGRIREYLLDPVRFSPDGRMPSFHLDGSEALDLAGYLVQSRDEAFEVPAAPGNPERGRALVRHSGCLACHKLTGVESSARAPPLAGLDESGGCLAESVPEDLPRYRLTGVERQALRTFVAGYRMAPDLVPAPTFDLPRRLTQLRCRACHELNGQAPTGPLAETAPSLTGIGAKLRRDWIERAIGSKTQTLDWQQLRMPSYGREHANWLADALAKASGVDPREPEQRNLSGRPQTGLDRLGVDGSRGGMGCIGCHGWGEYPSLGENGPNLFEAGSRLREPWFRLWMREPARVLAGTSMPSYFGGAETADSLNAIGELWAALRAAPDLSPPFGFRTVEAALGSEERPVPRDGAIVIRWDMPESTAASIAVGLPGGISYCFDAGESLLRYAWRGGFVDLSRTLYTKKNRETNLTETAEIVGEIFFRAQSFPIRVGDKDRIPRRRFRGYRLIDSIPEFHYEVDGVDVFERIDAAEGGLVRQFRIGATSQPMWFVPGGGQGIEIRSTLDGFEIPRGGNVSFEVSVVINE